MKGLLRNPCCMGNRKGEAVGNGIRWNCQIKGVFGVIGRQDQEIPFIEESLGDERTRRLFWKVKAMSLTCLFCLSPLSFVGSSPNLGWGVLSCRVKLNGGTKP